MVRDYVGAVQLLVITHDEARDTLLQVFARVRHCLLYLPGEPQDDPLMRWLLYICIDLITNPLFGFTAYCLHFKSVARILILLIDRIR